MKDKKIFLIAPVRNIPNEYRETIEDIVHDLEGEGHIVYYPARDTNQSDFTGFNICKANKIAMRKSDIVYVIWDGKSQGCLFDLGMAFAMNKRIRTITGYMPRMSHGKSFQNMIFAWEEQDYE